MKTMFIAIAALNFIACNAQEKTITINQLPKKAQEFVTAYFPNMATSYITEEKGIYDTEYEVHFTGGAEVEFDQNGNWKEVEVKNSIMPKGILPKNIADYLTLHYKSNDIKKIEHGQRGYDVDLVHGPDLEFDNFGTFLRIDD